MSDGRVYWWNRFIPTHVKNPFSLAHQLIASDSPAARSVLLRTAAGITLTPVDLLLRRRERSICEKALPPTRPVIIIVGPPRSGTTLVARYLMNAFEVSYLNNLTMLFPGSPISALALFGSFAPLQTGGYHAYYGRSPGLSGANDALYLWDRWLGPDRSAVPDALQPDGGVRMRQFFGALEGIYGLPVVNKVNRLNTCAHLVADELPTATFFCLQREPLYLAQSLYIAREAISGRIDLPYGTRHPHRVPEDPVEDVCRQVIFHEEQARKQQERLGPERFAILAYEDFCRDPAAFAYAVARRIPLLTIRDGHLPEVDFSVSRTTKLSQELLDRMQTRLEELGAGRLEVMKL